MSVNRPTNQKQKEDDIQRKIQIYGIYKAFEAGKVPSNEQIDITLNSFLASRALASPSKKLSREGQGLVQDFRSVVEQAKNLLLTKNSDELIQDFIWQCQCIDGGGAVAPGAPVDQATAQQHGKQVKDGIKTLGQLIITNGEFRKLLNDAVVLLRDIAGDVATNAAGKVNPSEDQLKQIDRPADDNVWHENPNISSGNIKNQMKQTFKKNAPVGRDDVRDAVGDASQNAHPSGSRDPTDTAQLAGRDQQNNTASGVDGQAGAQAAASTLKQRVSENVPEETKQRGRETRDRTKNYLYEKMPEERREQLIYRLKKMVVEIQGHSDYMQAITTLLDLAEQYGGHAQNLGQQGSGAVRDAHSNPSLNTAKGDLKTLLERFANYTSTDDLTDSINAIYQDADRDPELKSWFKEMNYFVRRCLKEQGYIMEDDSTKHWNELYDRGNFLLRDRYRPHTDRILDEVKFLTKEFDNDTQNKRFADTCQKLFNDLGNDENGKPTFKKHLVQDLTNVIIPAAIESIRYMPIPRLEYRDPQTEVVIENLVIESDNLMPNLVNIDHESNFRFGRKGFESKKRGSVTIDVSGIQMDLKDVSYYFYRKSGTPIHHDQGVLDIFLGGTGLSFKMRVSTADKRDRQNFFKVDSVDVDIKHFKLKIKQSKHKILFTLGKSLMVGPLTKAIGKAVEAAIKQKFEEADAFAYKIKVEVDRAQEEAAKNPENVSNIYRNYVSAVQRELTKGKEKAQKAQQAASDKEFKMAMTMDDSMFPNISLPGGISSKATEYKKVATTGGGWGSTIFRFGSAPKSTNVPFPKKIERKPHSVAQGGVRGPQNLGNTSSSAGPSGYNQGTQQGYSQQGYAQGTQQGAQQGFNQQVDQAFGNAGAHPNPTGTGLLNGNTATSGGALNQKNVANNGGHTQLGANNPVLQGRV
ncbi:hypothetical protein SBOR_3553 [Sclerotinia borealis F-4128]|uniref:Uncharacterized protein n=1 Tax=Sclerotinia borealis (strain F-4128) TaxID=1432307 RepID=W9CJM8_SCLBF|nr:hypothetical protein SBOR_3553 [Sclerotinia borealis F-4128]